MSSYANRPGGARQRVERRGSARAPLYVLVQARGLDEPLWAWDIGMGGLQCRTRKPCWQGTYLDLTFTLPGTGEKLDVGAQVLTVHSLDDDTVSLGMRFCMPSARAQRAIHDFLESRRAMWEEQASRQPGDDAEPAAERPFERLLAEAYAAQSDLEKLGFVRGISLEHLPSLSDLTQGPILDDEVLH